MIVYRVPQITLTSLKNKTIAIIGFGNQGQPHALNLKESGLNVIVGARHGSAKKEAAEALGFQVLELTEAVKTSDVIMMMVPDDQMKHAYETGVKPHIKPGSYLGFCHGFAIHTKQIEPANNLNVFMLAPKAQGRGVRNKFIEGSGVPGLVAVSQNPSGDTLDVALAYGLGIGCGRVGVVETTFAQETESDLFSEQTILCGGLTQLIKTGFEVLVEAGYSPEVAYFECLYEVKLLADLIQEKGITGMREAISSTARFGDLASGERVIDPHVKETMRQVLKDIQSGEFVNRFLTDMKTGQPLMKERLEQDYHHPVEKTGRQLREQGIL